MKRRAKGSVVRALLVTMLLVAASSAHAQWTFSGSHIYNTNVGNVGIGTAGPLSKFHVSGGDISVSADFGIRKDGNQFIFGYSSTLPGIVMGSGDVGDKFKINAGGVERFRIMTNGTVGIGTQAPGALMHIRDFNETGSPSSFPSPSTGIYIERTYATASEASLVLQGSTKATSGTGRIYLGNADEYDSTLITGGAGSFTFYARNGGAPLAQVAAITSGGTLTATNIAAKYQDVAEWVPSTGDLSPGTVVVLNPDHSNQVMASHRTYDTRVAGVVSESPGVILGSEGSEKEKIATTGRVRVRVDATKKAIAIGDLLVTSDKPGVAMKSEPVNVAGIEMHRPGTIVGKALEPLNGGQGEILVLLSLQ
jgi:hypothetical protein